MFRLRRRQSQSGTDSSKGVNDESEVAGIAKYVCGEWETLTAVVGLTDQLFANGSGDGRERVAGFAESMRGLLVAERGI